MREERGAGGGGRKKQRGWVGGREKLRGECSVVQCSVALFGVVVVLRLLCDRKSRHGKSHCTCSLLSARAHRTKFPSAEAPRTSFV